jgi:adhesin transport system outer membrane protein
VLAGPLLLAGGLILACAQGALAQPAQADAPASQTDMLPVHPGVLAAHTAVVLAIARHPEIRGAEAVIARRQAEIALAESDRWPVIQYGVGPGYGRSYGVPGNEAAIRGSVGIEMPIYDFGATTSRIAAAKGMEQAAQASRLDTADKVTQATLSAYIDAAAAQERMVTAKGAIKAMEQVQARISQRAQAGLSDRSDLNAANIAVQRALIDAEMAKTTADAAVSRLIELVGVVPTELSPLKEVDELVSARKREQPNFERSPAILAARSTLEAAGEKIKTAEAEQYPSIGVSVNRTFSTGSYSANDGTWFGLNLRGSFALGGAGRQRVAAARAERSAAEQDLEARRLEARSGWYVATREEDGARRRFGDLLKILNLWEQTRDLYWQEYILDKRRLSDVINAEQEIQSAAAQRVSTRAEAVSAAVKALVAQGGLLSMLEQHSSQTLTPAQSAQLATLAMPESLAKLSQSAQPAGKKQEPAQEQTQAQPAVQIDQLELSDLAQQQIEQADSLETLIEP